MNSLLEAKNLEKSFGELKAVRGISLTVAKGQCFALLGPNGAGKTTTVEMLEGLQQPDSGEIKIFDKSLNTNRRDILERVGILLQETHLYKKLTVKETLQLFASFFKKPGNVDAMIKKFGLEEKANARLEHLSGGQKQRLYLGCSLINDPELVFLDEPTTGLDPQARRMIWELLKELKADNRSILLTTHYMEEAEYLADYVAIVDKGQIIVQGTPKQLIRDICGEQTLWISFGEEHKNDRKLLAEIAAKLPWFKDARMLDGGYELLTSQADKHIPELTEMAKALGLTISGLRMRSCTLEDVFLKLTGRTIRDA